MKQFCYIGLFVGLVSVLFQSCEGKDVAYEKTYAFENHLLTQNEHPRFEFENTADTFQLYNVVLSVVHEPTVSAFQLPLELGYHSPYGESVSIPIAIPLYNNKFQPIGTMRSDSLVELQQTLFYANSFRKGLNTFELALDSHQDSLFGIVSFSLSIERAN